MRGPSAVLTRPYTNGAWNCGWKVRRAMMNENTSPCPLASSHCMLARNGSLSQAVQAEAGQYQRRHLLQRCSANKLRFAASKKPAVSSVMLGIGPLYAIAQFPRISEEWIEHIWPERI